MKKNTLLILLFAVVSAFVFPLWANADIEKSASASVDIMSQYIWRGQQLSDEAVIQPSVGVTYGGFGANLWANYDTDTKEHNETDLTLNFANSMRKKTK